MAIHDFGFRGYDGHRSSALSRVAAIAWSDVKLAFKAKKFLIFYVLCISPALMAFTFVYLRFIVAEGHGEVAGLRFNRGLSRVFGMIDKVEFFVDIGRGGTTLLTILFSAVVGAGIISRDRQAGALEIYFTRGIAPAHYFGGKFLGVCLLLLCQVLLPFLAVWLFAVAVASAESQFFATTVGFIPRLIAAQVFLCGSLAFMVTALSSSTDSTRFALLRWAGGLFVLIAVSRILYRWLGDPIWLVVSPWKVLRRIAFEIAQAPVSELELVPALVAWAAMMAASALFLRKHLRPVEIVG